MLKQIETLRIRLNNIMVKVFARLNVLEENAVNATSSNITEGTLNTATTNRIVDLGNNRLDIIGTNNKKITNTTGNIETNLEVTDVSATIFQSAVGVSRYVTTNINGIYLDNNGENYINFLNSGELNLYSNTGNYRIGGLTGQPVLYDDALTSPKSLYLNPNGYLKHGLTTAFFISDSNLSPAVSGKPTLAEVKTYIYSLALSTLAALKNRVIYYTGTDSPVNDYTHAYYMAGDNLLFEISSPSYQDPLVVTATDLGTGTTTSNSPTINDVSSYLTSQSGISAYRNRYVLYDRYGSNFITKVFYVTNDDKILIVDEKYSVKYVTVNIPYPMIDTNLSNKIIGSVAIPQDLHVNGNYQIKQVKYNCVINGTGTNTVPITIKDAGGSLSSFTANAAFGGGQNNLGGVFLDFNDGRVLFFEAGTVTGAIEHLSITLTLA